jgi:hypothetical protein
MIGVRFSTWNPSPGFGYLIFATIRISAILTVIMTLRARRRTWPTMSRVRTTLALALLAPLRHAADHLGELLGEVRLCLHHRAEPVHLARLRR